MLPIICRTSSGQRQNPSRPWSRRLARAVLPLALLTALTAFGGRAEAADPVTHGDAYGEQISLKLQTLLATVQAGSGPLSSVSGDTSPFNKDASALSLSVGLGGYGTVLHTGLLLSHTDSASPSQVSSNATVHDLGISLVPVATLLSLHADEVQSSAAVGGTCGTQLTATGLTTLVNAGTGGTLGLGLQIGATVPPNTVLLNLLGVRVVLNEQAVGGDGITSRSISVNAIHISVQNSLLGPLGRLTGDIVIAHSNAQVVCAPPPPPPTPKADLGVTLAAAPNPVTVGQTLTYTLNVANAGPSDATGTVLSDQLPAGVSLVSAQPSQGACSGTTTLSCSLGTVPAGGSASVVLQVIPNAAGTLTDSASVTSGVTDPNTTNNNASITVTAVAAAQPVADLSLSLTAAPNPVTVGQTLTYTLNVSNAGPSDATGTVLSDQLPAGVSLASAQPTQGACSGTTTLSCSLGTVPAGGSASVVLQVIANAAGTLTDTASVTSGVTDPNPANNNASVTVNAVDVPQPVADISLSLTAAPNPVTVGQTLTYTLNVSNAGPSDATGTVLSDQLPAGVSLVSAQPSQGACSGTTTVSCSLGTVPAGGSASVVLQVIPNAAGTLTDTAGVTSGVTDPDTSNNSAAVTVDAVDVPGEADLAISLGADQDPVQTGQVLTYFVDVANFGPSDAVGVILSNVLPAGVSLVSAQPAQGSCTGTTTLTCALGTIADGNDVSIEIQVIPNQAGLLTDTASATSAVDDPDTDNNETEVTVTAEGPAADLALSLAANPHPVLVGQTLTYTLTVTNAGPWDATDASVSNVLPAGVTLISAQPSQGECSGTTTLTCSLGTVAVGSDASIVIQVLPNQAGHITDSASATSDLSDPDPSNNSASVTVIVYTGQEPQADLSLTKQASVTQASVGQQFDYQLTVSNAGPAAATGVVVTDPLPDGLVLVSVTSSQGDCTGTDTITCTLGTIADGASATITLTVQAQGAGNLVNQATVTADTADMNDSDNTGSAAVSVRSPE
jgi:uncharacterized repeat protein (TIGR01451 family)